MFVGVTDSCDGYARISDDRDGTARGVGRQVPDIQAFAAARNLVVDEMHVDNDISAYKGKRTRPAYQQLYDRVKSGAVRTIIVWHLDRLYRSTRELEDLIDLVEATKVRILTVTGGDFDLNTTDGRAMARVVVAFNQKESEDKSRRIKRMHLELAESGRRVGGGTRPFGYLADRITPNPAEAELVREAAHRVMAGESVRSICTDWNRRGIATVSGKRWTMHVLRRILTSPSIAGMREHHGRVVARGCWPAIIDEATLRRLQAVLLAPDRKTNTIGGGVHARSYLLTGLLYCGNCGARMVARPKADKRRAYVCASGPGFHGCGRMGVLAEPIEGLVRDVMCEGVDDGELAERIRRRKNEAGDQELLDEIRDDEAALEQLAHDLYVARPPLISRAQFVAATQTIERRLEATRRKLVHSTARSNGEAWVGRGCELRAEWEAHPDLGWRRAVVGSLLERVIIGPAIRGLNRFDNDRITVGRGGDVVWRL